MDRPSLGGAAVKETLEALFEAERTARGQHAALLTFDRDVLVVEAREAIRVAFALDNDAEQSVRLVRLAVLLADLEGADVVDLLIDILGSEQPDARVAAGEGLEALAFDRFKEVALGIERALARLSKGSPALTELPFLLAEVAEPGCLKLLGRFLEHDDAEAVAAAIEALAELGDPAAIPMLSKLERDGRQVQIEDEEGGGERVAIADLATEAKDLLEEMAEDAAPRPPLPKPGKKGKGGGGR
jgi:HEAT repeat protein